MPDDEEGREDSDDFEPEVTSMFLPWSDQWHMGIGDGLSIETTVGVQATLRANHKAARESNEDALREAITMMERLQNYILFAGIYNHQRNEEGKEAKYVHQVAQQTQAIAQALGHKPFSGGGDPPMERIANEASLANAIDAVRESDEYFIEELKPNDTGGFNIKIGVKDEGGDDEG